MSDDDLEGRSDDEILDELRALAGSLGREPVEWETPPAGLWQRISAAVSDERADAPAELQTTPPTGPPPATGTVTSLAEARSRRRPRWAAAAAAAVALIAVGAVVVLATRGNSPEIVTEAPLERLGDAGEGHAELVDRDGAFELRLSTSGVAVEPGTFAEVWVINTDVTEMISLGPLRRDGRYELPDGIDPAAFPIVDVSIEPLDGTPTHSGHSVLRGQLTF